jgi:nicotinamidase-related amidase
MGEMLAPANVFVGQSGLHVPATFCTVHCKPVEEPMSPESFETDPVPRRHLLKAAAGAGVLLFAPTSLSQGALAAAVTPPAAGPGGTTMTYAPLNPEQTVILFADLQAGIIERGVTNELPRLRRTVAALAKLAHLFDIPAIVTTAPTSEPLPRVTPEITASLGDLPLHTRNSTDAFLHAETREAILATNRSALLVAGVATEIIVQHTALSGVARGLHVEVVIDACSGISGRTEDAALRRLEQSGVVITSAASVGAQLAGDLSQPKGVQAMVILYELMSN